MRAIAIILLFAVFVRNFSIFGGLWDWASYSPQAMFYMLGGTLEMVLCGVIFFIMLNANTSYWRNLALFAMGIGFIEGMTTTGCRLLIHDIFILPNNIHMCDWKFGFSFQGWRLTMYLLIIAVYTFFGRKRNATKPARFD